MSRVRLFYFMKKDALIIGYDAFQDWIDILDANTKIEVYKDNTNTITKEYIILCYTKDSDAPWKMIAYEYDGLIEAFKQLKIYLLTKHNSAPCIGSITKNN